MSFRTVGDLKDSIAGLLTGVNLNNVTNLTGALYRAKNIMAMKADVPETIASESITLYDGVYAYESPSTIFGSAIVDIRPQGQNRTPADYNYKQDMSDFDRLKGFSGLGYRLTFEYSQGTPILKVDQSKAKGRVILDNMSQTTGWTAAGSASGLVADATVIYEASNSLRFTLTGASTGTLTKAVTQVDISDYENVAVGFLAIRASAVTNLTSISVRVGSSASAYDEVSATEGFLGAWTAGEWTIVAFDFAGATSTGTPDWNAIDYLQVRIAHTATITNFWVGGFWLSLPSPHEIFYQSAAIFKASGSNPSTTITDDNDSILLSAPAYTIYEHEAAHTVSLQMSGGKATAHSQNLFNILHNQENGLYTLYRADNPSQELRSIGNWYD